MARTRRHPLPSVIGDKVVPAAEVRVLKVLVEIGQPAEIHEIEDRLDNTMSYGSIYSLLNRLKNQRELVERKEKIVQLGDGVAKRLIWYPCSKATEYFKNTEAASGEK